jgi:hypothetical protein
MAKTRDAKTASVTHILHWIPPEIERTRKWFGRQASEWGYWELQPLDAWESGRHESEADFSQLDVRWSKNTPVRDLAESVGAALGCQVVLAEDKTANGKGLYVIPGWHHAPIRWLDAPVYEVRPAGR